MAIQKVVALTPVTAGDVVSDFRNTRAARDKIRLALVALEAEHAQSDEELARGLGRDIAFMKVEDKNNKAFAEGMLVKRKEWKQKEDAFAERVTALRDMEALLQRHAQALKKAHPEEVMSALKALLAELLDRKKTEDLDPQIAQVESEMKELVDLQKKGPGDSARAARKDTG